MFFAFDFSTLRDSVPFGVHVTVLPTAKPAAPAGVVGGLAPLPAAAGLAAFGVFALPDILIYISILTHPVGILNLGTSYGDP